MDKWLHKKPATNIINKLLMKHLKKIFTALILGFLAFAPPGTLILIAIFTLGLLGKTWFILGLITGSILLAVYGFVYRNKLAENRHLKTFLKKFKK
ncbi:MAG: hypothetical protein M3R14_14235 [Acidobacteriota bacterium]|nr:hypothetical protein [Acidobacteriota bacterium]